MAFAAVNRRAKKVFLPIDLSCILGYYLDNGSGSFNFKIATTPII
jgi:hypothetical protein